MPIFDVIKIIKSRHPERSYAMPTKTSGTQAPPILLKDAGGQSFSLHEALCAAPMVVVAFFKVSCPVCHYAFPFLQRLHRAYLQVPIWGIAQDGAAECASFASEHGVTFPMPLDQSLETTASFGLVSVPSTFAVKNDGTIDQVILGFAKKDFEKLNVRMAEACGVEPKTLFTEDDDISTLQPGCGSKQPT